MPHNGVDDENRAASWEATRADVISQLRMCLSDDLQAATAVVTNVEGSAYRRPGARLVVTGDSMLGAITAGCLEGPVAERAREVIESSTPSRQTYDLTDDEDDSWGMGLGCNGVIDLLVDPVDKSLRPALDALAQHNPAVVLTVLEVDAGAERAPVAPGDRTTVLADDSVADSDSLEGTGREPLPADFLDEVPKAIDADSISEISSARTVEVPYNGTTVQVFCDPQEPIPTLLLFGSQGDVRPVSRYGRNAGFRVLVVTNRGAKADSSNFPAANTVRSVRAPDLAEAVDDPEHTYAVLMSHNFLDDRFGLESLLDTEIPYIGLMGPRKRFEEMKSAFETEGKDLSQEEMNRIATPIGLDLGGDEPTQIALSIVAEVLAAKNGRAGGRLSSSDGPIHTR